MNYTILGIIIAALGITLLIMEFIAPGIYIGVLGAALFVAASLGLIWQGVFWKVFFIGAAATLVVSSYLFYILYQKTAFIKGIKVTPDSHIGKKAIVTEKIDPISGTGKIRVAEEIWIARADSPIEVNEEVVIEDIQGITAIVKKI